MNIEDIIREARERKEARVAALPEDADLRPTVIVERAGRRIATIESPTVDKEAGLFAARMGAQGYGADAITILLDAHIKLMKPGDATPAPGELQRLCDTEGACDLGQISDTLIVQRIYADGRSEAATCPYKYHGSQTIFRWTHGIEEMRSADFDGYVSDSLREALKLARDNSMAAAIARKFGLDRERSQRHADDATTIALGRMGFKVIEESLIIDPTRVPLARVGLIIPAHA